MPIKSVSVWNYNRQKLVFTKFWKTIQFIALVHKPTANLMWKLVMMTLYTIGCSFP